jgi:thiosulfate/3-mercaptopyruvate sulfurtransferase
MIALMKRVTTRRRAIVGITSSAILPFLGRQAEPSLALQSDDAWPYIVSRAWLADQLQRGVSNVLVLDVSDLNAYRDGHIPVAVHSFWLETVERDYDVFGTVLNQKGVNSDLDDQGRRRAWFDRHQIGSETHVIVYDRDHGFRSARIVWFLRFLGHDRVSLLDGGFEGWMAEGLRVARGEERAPERTSEPTISPRTGFYLATGELEALIASNGCTLVDIRTDDERRDTIDEQFGTGVIPGSISLPRNLPEFQLDAFATGFDAGVARANLVAAGLDPDALIVLYGRFGTDANQMWVVMKAAGYAQVVIYDRGWVEWNRTGRPSLPIT